MINNSAAAAPVSSVVNGQIPYASLPPVYKKAIDDIHDKIWNHKRAMARVSTMAPVLLRPPQEEADAAASGGGGTSSLPNQLKLLEEQILQLEIQLSSSANDALTLKQTYETSTTQSILHGIWPIEALAARKGVKLRTTTSSSSQQQQQQQQNATSAIVTSAQQQQQQGIQLQQQQQQHTATNYSSSPATMTITEQIRKSLELQAAQVDRLEKIPSPYMWKTLEDTETRLDQLRSKIDAIGMELQQRNKIETMGLTSVVQSQTDQLLRLSTSIGRLQREMEMLRNKYNSWENTSKNVLTQQRIKDLETQQKQEERIKIAYLKIAAKSQPVAQPVAQPTSAFGGAGTSGGGLFGSTKPSGLFGSAPAPSSGLFGSAPAPGGGGVFGSAPAPTGGGGSLFGNTTAPSAGGGVFGNTLAPAAGNVFGAKPPASSGVFGSTTATAAAPSGGLFSNAPAPSGGLFGSTTPAPAFGGTSTTKTTTSSNLFSSGSSKNKSSKSRSSRRK